MTSKLCEPGDIVDTYAAIQPPGEGNARAGLHELLTG